MVTVSGGCGTCGGLLCLREPKLLAFGLLNIKLGSYSIKG